MKRAVGMSAGSSPGLGVTIDSDLLPRHFDPDERHVGTDLAPGAAAPTVPRGRSAPEANERSGRAERSTAASFGRDRHITGTPSGSSIRVPHLLSGTAEWSNIQEAVRFALRDVLAHMAGLKRENDRMREEVNVSLCINHAISLPVHGDGFRSLRPTPAPSPAVPEFARIVTGSSRPDDRSRPSSRYRSAAARRRWGASRRRACTRGGCRLHDGCQGGSTAGRSL